MGATDFQTGFPAAVGAFAGNLNQRPNGVGSQVEALHVQQQRLAVVKSPQTEHGVRRTPGVHRPALITVQAQHAILQIGHLADAPYEARQLTAAHGHAQAHPAQRRSAAIVRRPLANGCSRAPDGAHHVHHRVDLLLGAVERTVRCDTVHDSEGQESHSGQGTHGRAQIDNVQHLDAESWTGARHADVHRGKAQRLVGALEQDVTGEQIRADELEMQSRGARGQPDRVADGAVADVHLQIQRRMAAPPWVEAPPCFRS